LLPIANIAHLTNNHKKKKSKAKQIDIEKAIIFILGINPLEFESGSSFFSPYKMCALFVIVVQS
jgi:hypothetical protein